MSIRNKLSFQGTKMRNIVLPVVAAACLMMTGAFILNIQLWYSFAEESLHGARYATQYVTSILNEASLATQTAINITDKGCNLDAQYQLGTEAALQPHLRTIVIVKKGKVWCSSLPGNHVLLTHLPAVTGTNLLLLPASDTTNGLPVLIYQTRVAANRILVTISDQHIRRSLTTSLKGVKYALRIGHSTIGLSGDITPINNSAQPDGRVDATAYPFSIIYDQPPLFSLQRMVSRGSGILVFILLISCATAYALYRYLNKHDTPADTLRKAISHGEIVPFYQPIVNGLDGTIRGVEVLARWKHPKGGYISPDSFIPVAEKSGLIVPLTQNLMQQVVADMNAIATRLPEGFHLGINFSAFHLASPTVVAECLQFRDSFNRSDLQLVIEVTEREPLHVNEELIEKLNILHKNGFAIALDDFCTGYSGISYLHDLHIDYIKIDQSFVGRVNSDKESTRILDCVLELAHTLSIKIVAEGVETKEQLDYLNQNAIPLLQGYYFYKPMDFSALTDVLLLAPTHSVNS